MYLRGVLLAQPFWRIVESMSSGTIIWFRRINFHRFQEHVPYYNVVILQSKFKYFLGSTIQAVWHAKWSPLLLLTSCSVKQLSQILDLRKAGWGHCKEWNRHNWEKTNPIGISILRWKGIVCCHNLKFGRYNFLFTSALPNTKGMVRICKIRFISGSVPSAIRSLCQQLKN